VEAGDGGSVLAELRAARAAIAARLATLDRLTREAADRVYQGGSPDGTVLVRVDGNGRLLDLVVAPGALRTGHPERLGPEIVAAVTAARESAAGERTLQVRAHLRPG
jgi:DNA-binding protein YbaB